MSIKRFYQNVEAVEAEGGFGVALDGRRVRTPGRATLCLQSLALAEAVAAEWQAQGETIRPDSMILMQIAATATDRVSGRRDAVVSEIAGYARSDLLCHRAEAPPNLVARQQAEWQPLLDWAAAQYGARFTATVGVMPAEQPADTLAACHAAVDAYDDLALAALHLATSSTGSLVITLALAADRLGPEEAWSCSQLDETFQIERWGLDAEAERRRENIRSDIAAAARFLKLLRE